MNGPARVDYSKETGAVAQCTACPHWWAMRHDRREAWQAIREHEKRCHPGATQATIALDGIDRRTREAASRERDRALHD